MCNWISLCLIQGASLSFCQVSGCILSLAKACPYAPVTSSRRGPSDSRILYRRCCRHPLHDSPHVQLGFFLFSQLQSVDRSINAMLAILSQLGVLMGACVPVCVLACACELAPWSTHTRLKCYKMLLERISSCSFQCRKRLSLLQVAQVLKDDYKHFRKQDVKMETS